MLLEWFNALIGTEDEDMKISLLFVMNEVIMKGLKAGAGQEYLGGFSGKMEDIIQHLTEDMKEAALEDIRRILVIWECNGVFTAEFTDAMKAKAMEGLGSTVYKRSGAKIIEDYEITKKLATLENLKKMNTQLCANVESAKEDQTESGLDIDKALNLTGEYKAMLMEELTFTEEIMMELSKMLETEYRRYKRANMTA